VSVADTGGPASPSAPITCTNKFTVPPEIDDTDTIPAVSNTAPPPSSHAMLPCAPTMSKSSLSSPEPNTTVTGVPAAATVPRTRDTAP
jgi:hypothetical protein